MSRNNIAVDHTTMWSTPGPLHRAACPNDVAMHARLVDGFAAVPVEDMSAAIALILNLLVVSLTNFPSSTSGGKL